MFILKKKYFIIIESIKDIDLSNIKKYNKFIIIYRSKKIKDNISSLIRFRKICNLKKIKFYIANNLKLCFLIKSDGLYLSAHNKTFKALNFKKSNFNIIGSAHNYNEISLKINQGCDYILLSKLFSVSYDKKAPFLDLCKFNQYSNIFYKKLIPLGGINSYNLNKLKIITCEGFALFTEAKKKPAIIDRLF